MALAKPNPAYNTLDLQATHPDLRAESADERVAMRTPRTRRDRCRDACLTATLVSIHTPRVRRDGGRLLISHGLIDVSIHTPRAGRDIHLCRSRAAQCRFNPHAA
jgi:hypothetical protein